MATVQSQSEVGSLLRDWRERRRVKLKVLQQLEVPFREQNRLLLAAGHAPAYPERSLEDSDLAPVKEALDVILTGHEPYPTVAVDRAWNMVAANSAMLALTEAVEIAPELLESPINVIRIGLHPRGLGPLFINLGDWHAHWLKQLEHQWAATGDAQLASLIAPGRSCMPGWTASGDMDPCVRRRTCAASSVPPRAPAGPLSVTRVTSRTRRRDMGAAGPTPPLRHQAERRIAADPDLTTAMVRVLNHELRPSKAFTPAFSLNTLANALREGRGDRRPIMREAGMIVADGARRWRMARGTRGQYPSVRLR